MARRQVPSRGNVRFSTPGLSDHFFADKQAQLDADAGEPDPMPAHFCAGRNVMIAPHLLALHARAVIYGGESALLRIGCDDDAIRAGIQ
jgi:hypothetical protein